MRKMRFPYVALLILTAASMLLAACAPAATAVPTQPPAPTAVPATAVPPTVVPPTAVPPTAVPPTAGPTVTATKPTPTPVPDPVCAPMAGAPTVKAGDLGSADNPIVMAFVPSGEAGKIATASTKIADCLNKMTGLTYKVQTGTSYAAAIEAMGANKAQIGFLNTFSILIAEAKYGIIPALVNIRNYATNSLDPDKDLGGKLEPFYKGQFIASVASGIKSLADLKGKNFCFVEPNSTSGYIVPRIILKANGIDPDKDFKQTVNAGSHPNVAIGVYKGQCDAGVTFIDVLTDKASNLQGQYADIADKVQVFAVTDRIPNDGVQYVKTFAPALQKLTTDALLAMSKDPGGKAVLASLYTINAFQQIEPTFYDDFNNVLKKAGVDAASLVK